MNKKLLKEVVMTYLVLPVILLCGIAFWLLVMLTAKIKGDKYELKPDGFGYQKVKGETSSSTP